MTPRIILEEDDFTFEFITAYHFSESSHPLFLQEAIGNDAFVLQEKIIVPPRLAGAAAGFSASVIDPARCNKPLILIGHNALPPQYASFIVRPKHGRARAEKRAAAIRLAADNMNILFSAPLLSHDEKTVESFCAAFDQISAVLRDCDMQETHIARTWLYLDEILNDYEILNQAREAFFAGWYPLAGRMRIFNVDAV
ncbi:MAG: hypothetical protein R6W75_08345, partial [Smithellaceae bacterium]